jgi:hypothetical protein
VSKALAKQHRHWLAKVDFSTFIKLNIGGAFSMPPLLSFERKGYLMMLKISKSVVMTICSLFFFSSANAQDFPVMYSSPTGGLAGDLLMNRQMLQPIVQQVEGTKRQMNGGESTSPILSSNISVSLTYTPSSSRTRANLQNFVNKSRRADPEGAAKLEQLFASTNIIGEIGKGMRSVGLNKNNAADAFALYWINAWEASRGSITQTSAAKAQAVAAQAASGLSSSPEFSRATDAQKQEMAEALMIQAVMIEGYIEAAEGNPQQLKAIANAVRQGAKASGLDLDAMTLTEQGFVKATGKKRSDATEALPGADNKQLASASAATGDTGEDTGSGLFPGILIAGLAGSGLAAAFLYGKNKGVKKSNG